VGCSSDADQHEEHLHHKEKVRTIAVAGSRGVPRTSNLTPEGINMVLVALAGTSLIVALMGLVLPLAACVKGN
jgi:hypothetical protein